MQQFVKFVRHFLIRKHATVLCFASGFVRGALDMDCGTFCQTYRNSANAPHFHGKTRIAALNKTVHCAVAIKVWRTRWKKRGAHAAMFSSAAAAHFLHSF